MATRIFILPPEMASAYCSCRSSALAALISGLGLAVYPFGSSSGPSLMLKGSYETLPVFRVAIDLWSRLL